VRAEMNLSKEKVEVVDKYLEEHAVFAFMKTSFLHQILGAVDKYEEKFD
jgi:hypothetical protein